MLRISGGLISKGILWTSAYGFANVDRLVSTYIYQVCVDTGCSLDDLLEVIDDRNR